MNGFLSFIASQYRRKPEDVATDAMAYLMHYRSIQRGVSDSLKELGFPHLSPGFKVVTRSSTAENGIPDICLIERQGQCRVIIENKFGAPLTDKQPCGYLKEIMPDGLVLFVVPRWRRAGVWNKIRGLCEAQDGPMSGIADEFIGRSSSGYLAIVTWDYFIKVFSVAIKSDISCGSDSAILVDQLRRLCNVEQQRLEHLDAQLLAKSATASSVYACVPLVTMLLDAAEDRRCFEREKRADSEGCFGEWGQLGQYHAWIGFDARVWADKGGSPIWIEFDDKAILDELRGIFLAARERFSWLDDPIHLEDENNGENQLVIPVPLEVGVEYDELLRKAVERIEQVAILLRPKRKRIV